MTHPSHKTRFSDSSLYDEICMYCGATDGRGSHLLEQKCPEAPVSNKEKERQGFLLALKDDEDDIATRSAYIDWLLEHDEPEEAERMREFPEAKAWMQEFADSGGEESYDDDYRPVFNYKRLIDYGYEAASNGSFCFYCGANETMQDQLNSNKGRYWRAWSTITGIPVPEDVEDRAGYFSCGC